MLCLQDLRFLILKACYTQEVMFKDIAKSLFEIEKYLNLFINIRGMLNFKCYSLSISLRTSIQAGKLERIVCRKKGKGSQTGTTLGERGVRSSL